MGIYFLNESGLVEQSSLYFTHPLNSRFNYALNLNHQDDSTYTVRYHLENFPRILELFSKRPPSQLISVFSPTTRQPSSYNGDGNPATTFARSFFPNFIDETRSYKNTLLKNRYTRFQKFSIIISNRGGKQIRSKKEMRNFKLLIIAFRF